MEKTLVNISRRFAAVLAAFLLVFAFAACDHGNGGAANSGNSGGGNTGNGSSGGVQLLII